MDNLSSILNFLNLALIIIAGLFLRSYLPKYMDEKAKNKATKEDISEITEKVENIKKLHNIEIETLKAQIADKDKITQKRRENYEKIVDSLRVFIRGHENNGEVQIDFYKTYSNAWLWAPNSVLSTLNEFVDLQVKIVSDPCSVTQEQIKESYEKVVLEMRKDLGFSSTEHEKYRFFNFA